MESLSLATVAKVSLRNGIQFSSAKFGDILEFSKPLKGLMNLLVVVLPEMYVFEVLLAVVLPEMYAFEVLLALSQIIMLPM